MDATKAAERIKKALEDNHNTRGFRGPEGEQEHVEVLPADVVAVAEAVADPDEIVEALHLGSSTSNGKPVCIQADDAYHLLEQFARK